MKVSMRVMLFLLFLCMLGITGCSIYIPSRNTNRIPLDNAAAAAASMRKSNVRCADPNLCNDSVGGLFAYFDKPQFDYGTGEDTPTGIGACNFTLTASDEVITNVHCIPRYMAVEGTDCSKHIVLKFPETNNYAAEEVQCAQVLHVSKEYDKENANSPDWAVLKLARSVNRPVPQKSFAGLENKSKVLMFPATYTFGAGFVSGDTIDYYSGTIKKYECVSNMGQFLAPHYNHKNSPLIGGTCDHNLLHGNSGSGVFTVENQLTGVFSFSLKKEVDEIELFNRKFIIQSAMFGGANMACLDYYNAERSELCHYNRGQSARIANNKFKLFFGSRMTDADKDYLDRITNTDERIHWSAQASPDFREFYGENIGQATTSLSVSFANQYQAIAVEKRFPAIPSCVEESLKSKTSKVVMPYVDLDYESAELSMNGNVHAIMALKPFVVDFSFNFDTQIFEGRLSISGKSGDEYYDNAVLFMSLNTLGMHGVLKVPVCKPNSEVAMDR